MDKNIAKKFAEARSLYPHTKEVTWLNSASQAPFSSEIEQDVAAYLKMRSGCLKDDHHSLLTTTDKLRADFANLIGATKQEIGLAHHTTFGLNLAAFGLPMPEGSEVLLSDVEFPAAVYTWQTAARSRGFKVSFVKSNNKCFDIEEFKKGINENTKALCLSWVQFFNGYKNDLSAISKICKAHGIYFVVDGIQGAGTEPINVTELGIDIFTTGAQKWLLSAQGGGFFFVADRIRKELIPPFGSWMDVDWQGEYGDLFRYDKPRYETAQAFEMGYYSVMNIISLVPSIRLISNLGLANIKQHIRSLTDQLAAYIDSSSYYRVTSSMVEKHRSSILTFSCDNYTELFKQLDKKRIVTACREGSIRVSPHLFNDQSDIERLIEELEKFSN